MEAWKEMGDHVILQEWTPTRTFDEEKFMTFKTGLREIKPSSYLLTTHTEFLTGYGQRLASPL
jgi:hypothetical protein